MTTMWMLEIPPFVPFFIGALLAAVTRGHLRSVLMVATPVLSAIHLWMVPEGIHLQFAFFDYQLTPYRADKLSFLFAYVFHIAAFMAVIFALHIKDTMQHVAGLLYAGSALGAVFAGDLLTLFVFWELLALTSVFLVWARRTERAYVTGMRYLIIQISSGLILLAGVMFYAKEHGTLAFDYIGLNGIHGWLILLAFGIKCAFPFLHNWLTEAYAEATPTGSVFLSAFTTKLAVYALARGYPGTELLLYVGAAMASFPIFYAVIENDLRRVLAYSLINQVGFMVVGIGVGTAMALNGAAAHAFVHIIYKGLLFMSMGAVLQMAGKINGSELGGLYKTMPKTAILCIVGAASISAFPLFSGFVAKSMILSALMYEGHDVIWLILLFASAGVFHHAGIKIPYFAFFAHDSGIRAKEPPANMLLAMTIAAGLCIGIGVYPAALYSLLPFDADYHPYDVSHVLAQLQLLFFSALAFVWLNLRGLYPPELPSVNLDAEWLYRRVVPNFLKSFFAVVWSANAAARKVFLGGLTRVVDYVEHHHGPVGVLARTSPSGSMVLWVTLILAIILVLSFI